MNNSSSSIDDLMNSLKKREELLKKKFELAKKINNFFLPQGKFFELLEIIFTITSISSCKNLQVLNSISQESIISIIDKSINQLKLEDPHVNEKSITLKLVPIFSAEKAFYFEFSKRLQPKKSKVKSQNIDVVLNCLPYIENGFLRFALISIPQFRIKNTIVRNPLKQIYGKSDKDFKNKLLTQIKDQVSKIQADISSLNLVIKNFYVRAYSVEKSITPKFRVAIGTIVNGNKRLSLVCLAKNTSAWNFLTTPKIEYINRIKNKDLQSFHEIPLHSYSTLFLSSHLILKYIQSKIPMPSFNIRGRERKIGAGPIRYTILDNEWRAYLIYGYKNHLKIGDDYIYKFLIEVPVWITLNLKNFSGKLELKIKVINWNLKGEIIHENAKEIATQIENTVQSYMDNISTIYESINFNDSLNVIDATFTTNGVKIDYYME